MKIGVNARFLLKPFTGIGQYTKNIFKELAAVDSGNEYIMVVHEKVPGVVARTFPKNVRIKVIPEKKMGTAGMRKTWWEQISVPEFFEKEKVDIAFFPYPCSPWSKGWYKKGIKTVVTIHDCIPWIDENYNVRLLSKLYHSQNKKAVKMADLIFTVSESSKKDILKICRVDESKIEVVYNDAGDVYKEPIDNKNAGEVLKRFNLKKDKFFLYVGGYDERKNVKYLIDEYEYFAEVPLVLVGGKQYKTKLYKSFEMGGTYGDIVRTGFLDERTLAVLYGNCLAYISLSKIEGFNIPILEAANCGAPIILSDIDVHREVAGNAAIFVNLEKKGQAAKAMEKMLDERVRDDYANRSKKLAKKYSWKKYAQIVKDVLFSE